MKSFLPCKLCLSSQNHHYFLTEVKIFFFFLYSSGVGYKPSSLNTLFHLGSANTIINILRISSHTHYCIHSNYHTVTLYFYHRSSEWKKPPPTTENKTKKKKKKKKETIKWLCMLKFSGTETSKQSPTFIKNHLGSPLHYILQSQTKIQFLLF